MSAKVSIVIPCYNHGAFIEETVNSCREQSYGNIEIIIIDDGSTDEATGHKLAKLEAQGINVIYSENQGPVLARNSAIAAATGTYILPLDADDLIAPSYVEKAVRAMEEDPALGIIYCEAELFGAQQGRWELPEFSMPGFLNENCIFITALFRRSDWELVGGYKNAMRYGWEDWEFWLSLIELGRGVYKIPETLFFYRKHACTSMVSHVQKDRLRRDELWRQIFTLHRELYEKNMPKLSKGVRKRFNIFRGTPPFFYRERTATHTIYHAGPLAFKRPR